MRRMSELNTLVFSLHKNNLFASQLKHIIVCGYNENNIPQEITNIINHLEELMGKCEIFYTLESKY